MQFTTFLMGLLLFFGAFVNGALATSYPNDSSSAVVYAYFGVGGDDRDDASISLTSFKSHIREIKNSNNPYNIKSLPDIIKVIHKQKSLPDRTISLTFEGMDSSFITSIFPILRDNNIPFTVFITAGMADRATQYNDISLLSWDALRSLAESPLATFGMTSYDYVHLNKNWTALEVESDINRARARIREEMGITPRFFAYPYGETSDTLITAVKKQGFEAGFAQQSGAIGLTSPMTTLPRFTMIDDTANVDRLRMTATTLPLPITNLVPSATLVKQDPPRISFSVDKTIPVTTLKKMRCYATGVSKVSVTAPDKNNPHAIELRLSNPFDDSKGRLNCTLPAPALDGDESPRWRWLGFQFTFSYS